MKQTLKPGVYDNIPDHVYHGELEGLSSTGCKMLVRPGGAALFDYKRTHPAGYNPAFEIGHAAHALLLTGDMSQIVVINEDSWRTRAAREQRDHALDNGKYPLLAHEWEQVQAMVAACKTHVMTNALLTLDGVCERTIIWEEQGVTCKARPDRYTTSTDAQGTQWVIDYKTTRNADPRSFQRALGVSGLGYAQQAEWYIRGLRAAGLTVGGDVRAVFIAQEKDAPFLTAFYTIPDTALEAAARLNDRAIEIYREGMTSGRWAGYPDAIVPLELPTWEQNYIDELLEGIE